ncbi:MAG: NrsF family protein [Candidatus Acidiferrum sp.]
MKDREIDEILKTTAQAAPPVEPALLDRVAASLKPSMRPVRTIWPAWLLVSLLILICAAVALAGAAKSGFFGFQAQNALDRAMIFPALLILIGLAATTSVRATIPGSRRLVSSAALLAGISVALIALFGFLFRGYQTENLVPHGIPCLATGLLYAIPTALASWLALRRGFAVNSIAAATAAGTLAGLAGVAMLELHCANLQALHILLWHASVVPLSAAAGALLAWTLANKRFLAGR